MKMQSHPGRPEAETAEVSDFKCDSDPDLTMPGRGLGKPRRSQPTNRESFPLAFGRALGG